MVISSSKLRVPYTLKKENTDYLNERAAQEKKNRPGQVTASTILDELIEADRKIRKVFQQS